MLLSDNTYFVYLYSLSIVFADRSTKQIHL